ncbi:hypothetical protein [Nocardioides ferulae]|uniref:hypothetical protein n=1 Tax=Nocardioides ferulae TaxID=2340821 RepID=UPI000EABE171|nr:hypothetical protein [Nocardioides ferulae]
MYSWGVSAPGAQTLLAAAEPATERPAGAAPVDQVLIATGAASLLTLLLAVVVLGHRGRGLRVVDAALRGVERSRLFGGQPGWAALPLLVAMLSLMTALLGMYWDIALHIGVGRDEGPLANPAHYPIMFGLFGISAAGVLACALPRGDEAGPAAVGLSRSWRAPAGGVLLTAAGSYALLGFPLDDVWHRIFGQDVTLWGPTHLMLIGGAGLSLVAMAVLHEEGRVSASSDTALPERPLGRFLQRSFLMGGLLIGLSVFQAEFDFGVPQFRLVLQPLLIAVAAGLALVTARLWVGAGGAVAAAVFYLAVRGGVSLIVGPGLGELFAAVPLYLAEALLVELVALRLARRPLLLGLVSGTAIGTLGFAAEYWWTGVAFRLPWTPDILVEGVLLAVVGGVAGGLLGALLHLGLTRQLHGVRRPGLLFALSVAAIAAATVDGVLATTPEDLSAQVVVLERSQAGGEEHVQAEFRFGREPVDGEPAWLTVTGWQGSTDGDGLHVDHLEQVDSTTWRTTEPLPVDGTWKSMVRLHDGRHLTAMPVYLPADAAIDEPEIAAESGVERDFAEETLILQRELEDDVPGWLWGVAGLVVLLCSLLLVLGLGWGVQRFARAGRPGAQERVATPVG